MKSDTIRISDISTPDTDTQYRADVQLLSYHTPLNADLVRRFMFTRGEGNTGAGGGLRGTAELLDNLRQAASSSVLDNRFLFQATYGHGKSHFGLAIANFFGQPYGSDELEAVLGKLNHVLPAEHALSFREFRQNTAPFLVVVLRGDTTGSLRDGFFRSLRNELDRHEVTRDLQPPFWFDNALAALSHIESSEEYKVTAQAYLEPLGHDLVSLRKMIEAQKSEGYAPCIGAFKAVFGIEPNLGGETSLKDAVTWVATELCGPGKFFGGLLLLFDEFSMFVRDYRTNNPTGASLQELLNGVDDNRGRVLFVALTQHVPETVAMKGGMGADELIKELTRITDQTRYRIQTRLEDVLGAYFKINENNWLAFKKLPGMAMYITEASEAARSLFKERYGPSQLNLSSSDFQRIVTERCFPLHPLTTALLANLDLERSATVRSVLNFVMDKESGVHTYFARPAVFDGRPNWVLPTALVDYFGEALNEEAYKAYVSTVKADFTPIQVATLKAMLLIDIGHLSTKRLGSYAAAVAEFAGIREEIAQETLEGLERSRHIRKDSINNIYMIPRGSNSAMELDHLLNEELSAREKKNTLHRLLTTYTASEQNPVNKLKLGKQLEVDIDWGNATDWGIEELLLSVNSLKPGVLDAIKAQFTTPIDKPGAARGVVVLLLPQNQEETNAAPAAVRKIFDASSRYAAAPILFICPNEPHGDLITALHKLALLDEPMFKSAHEKRVGTAAYEEEIERLKKQVTEVLARIRLGGSFEVAPEIRGSLQARNFPKSEKRISQAMGLVYEIAYSKHPERFFPQYQNQRSPNFNRAVLDVAMALFDNRLDAQHWPAMAHIQRDIEHLLRNDWGILTQERQITEPQGGRIVAAWKRLNETFTPQAGRVSPREVLTELLQPPYGYDHNTLALLFTAWIGYHRTQGGLSIPALGNIKLGVGAPAKLLFKRPSELLHTFSQVEVQRKDAGAVKRKAQEALDALAGPSRGQLLELREAERFQSTLHDFLQNNPKFDAEFLEAVRLGIEKYQTGLDLVGKYEQAVREFSQKLRQRTKIEEVTALHKDLQKIPVLAVVRSSEPTVALLGGQLEQRLLTLTEQQATELEQLKSVEDYTHRESQLRGMRTALAACNANQAAERITLALTRLTQAKAHLEQTANEKQELSVLNAIPDGGGLTTLRQSLTALKNIEPKSKRAYDLANEKYERLTTQIGNLETQAKAYATQLDALTDVKEAKKALSDLLRESHLFKGAPEALTVQAALERAQGLETYFQDLARLENASTPEQGQTHLTQLQALSQSEEINLSAPQRDLAVQALSRLQKLITQKEQEALAWLNQQRAALAEGQAAAAVEKALNRPPAFFPETHTEELEAFRNTVRVQIDTVHALDSLQQKLRSLTAQGPLAELRRRQLELAALPEPNDAFRQEKLKRAAALAEAITTLESKLSANTQALAQAITVTQARSIADDLLRSESLYHNSELAEAAEHLTAQAQDVVGVLQDAAGLKTRVPTRLKELDEQAQRLDELLAHPALSQAHRTALQEQANALLEKRRQEEDRAEQALHDLAQRLSAAETLAELQNLDPRRLTRGFMNPKQLERLVLLETHLSAIRTYLQDTEGLLTTKPRSPQHLQELQLQLEERPRPEGAQVVQRRVQEILASWDQQASAAAQQASVWLTSKQNAFECLADDDVAGLERIKEELTKVPTFLKASDTAALNELQEQVRQACEENEIVRIELIFRQITSSEKRHACLARLQALLGVPELT